MQSMLLVQPQRKHTHRVQVHITIRVSTCVRHQRIAAA